MADFCNICAYDMWGEHIPADIDVPTIFRDLEPGYSYSVICEGCTLAGIGKNEDGCFMVVHDGGQWMEGDIREYIIPKNKRRKLCQKSEK